jgi:rod shape-determining protein MreC
MLAFGTGNPELISLRHVPINADVKMHDVVSTSGLGGRYPPDYPVARITRVERHPGEPFALVEARPFARLDRSREALLVWWESPAQEAIPQQPALEQEARQGEPAPAAASAADEEPVPVAASVP